MTTLGRPRDATRPTTQRPLLTPPTAPAPPRRRTGAATPEERFTSLGAVVGGYAFAWLVCYRLLPWGSLLALTLTGLVSTLVVAAVLAATTGGGWPVVADRLAAIVVRAGALVVGVALLTTIGYTFWRGREALVHLNQYTSDMAGVGPRAPLDKGGVLHAMLGSLLELAIAITVVVPLGVGTAVYMTEVGGRFARVVRTIVEAMTALPSIVAGLFVYTTLIVALGVPRSGFAAAVAIGVMMLPIIARASDVVLRVVPGNLREASYGLGASTWRTVWHVVLPTARPGLATALILGVARGVGETSPVLLTSGAASFVVTDPTSGVMNSLPLFVYSSVRSGEPMLQVRGFGAASILMALVLVLFVIARIVARPRRGRR